MPLTGGPAARSAATQAREPTATLDWVRDARAAAPDGKSAGDDHFPAALRGSVSVQNVIREEAVVVCVITGRGGTQGVVACSKRTAGGRPAMSRTDATKKRGRRGTKLSWRDAGSPGMREGARRRRRRSVATGIWRGHSRRGADRPRDEGLD